MGLDELSRWGVYLSNALATGLLIRLLWFHLAGKYGWLFGYLLTDVVQFILVIGAPRTSAWYGWTFFATEGTKGLIAMGVAVQLWLLALQTYPNLARLGRQIAQYLLLAAMLVAALGLYLQPSRSHYQSSFTYHFNAIQGALDAAIGLFLAVATLFLLWFPVVVPRNVAMLMGGVLVFSLQAWAALLLLNLFPATGRTSLDVLASMVEAGILTFWIWVIRPRGEVATTVTGHRWNPEEADHLLKQLSAINRRLDGASH